MAIFPMAEGMSANDEIVEIRSDIWLPYVGDSTSGSKGYMVEMAEAIAAKNGLTINYKSLPWGDALEDVRRGNADCVLGAEIRDAPDLLFARSSWGMAGYHFWGRADATWRYTGIASLSSVKFTVNENYSYGEALDEYILANRTDRRRVLEVLERPQAIAQVISGESDAYIDDPNGFVYALVSAGIDTDSFVSLGVASQPQDVRVACTPGSPRSRQLTDMFSDGTNELRASGKLAQILARYSMRDWK